MPRTSERGGPATRARILETAHWMFLERGYDAVTVAEIARQAGVSSVTVFNHFPRKEDLFLDRQDDAAALLRLAVRDRPDDSDVLSSLRATALLVFDERQPLSGVDERSLPFFRTVSASPALLSRSREIAADLERGLADELERDARFTGDAPLLAAMFMAGYTSVLVRTARRVLAGEPSSSLLDDHRERLERLFEVLRAGFGTAR